MLDQAVDHVDPDHLAATRTEDATGQLADEAEADHTDPLTDLRRRLANTLKGNAADGRERATLERNGVRKVNGQVAGT